MANKIQYGTVLLAGATPYEGPSGLTVDGQQAAQVADFLRADTVAVYGRGNKMRTVSFSVSRLHASIADAQSFLVSHFQNLPKQAQVIFTLDDGSQIFWSAVLTNAKPNHRGVSSEIQYTLIGGEFKGIGVGAAVDGGEEPQTYDEPLAATWDGGNHADKFIPAAVGITGGTL